MKKFLHHTLFSATVCCGVALVFPTAFAAAAGLEVIPVPREATVTGTGFDPSIAQFICVSDTAEDRFAAQCLQASMRETHGVECDVVLLPQATTNWHRLWLGSITNLPGTMPPKPSESYTLIVNTNGALAAADDDTGLFYGVQTLIQLLEQAGRDRAPVPGMDIRDWPEFAWRARYFDASQYFGSVVVTRESLEHEIKLLARYKLNWLCFEAYNFVPFKSFPACADVNTLSLADWNYLVELAHRYHVTLVPSLQSFAQIYDVIWNCDEGKPYREATAPGMICPSRPENIPFLQGLYRDLISIFKYTPVLGIGCSETEMQWAKHYCPLCRARIEHGETEEEIYYKHVRDCVHAVEAAARETGSAVRPMMWADEFYMGYNGKRWVGIENIPTNTVMGHWKYWKDYDTIAGLLQRGFDVFFLSATYQHNIYLVDLSPQEPVEGKAPFLLDSGVRNIADQASQAAIDSKKGWPGKVLGGGCATFSQHDIRCWDTTWFAYLLQSEYSWGEPSGPRDDVLNRFIDRFAAVFYQARTPQTATLIASAYRELDAVKSDIERNNYLIHDILGVYDVQDVGYLGNTLEASLKLIDALVAHPQPPGKTIADVRQRCEKALETTALFRKKLAAAIPSAGNAESLQYLVFAPHQMENHVRRTLLLLDMAEAFRKMDSTPEPGDRKKLGQTFFELGKQCAALEDDTRVICDKMDELTSSGGSSGCHQALASLDAFRKRLTAAALTLQKPAANN